VYDVGQIAGILFLGPTEKLVEQWGDAPGLGPMLTAINTISPNLGIYGFAYGTVFGAALHLLSQVPGLVRYGFRWTPRLTISHPGVQQVLKLMGPRVLTVAAFSTIFILNDNLASGFAEGSISALAFGWLLMQVPQTLIGTAGGIVLLPTFSEMVAQNKLAEVRALIRRALVVMAALTVPITVVAWLALPFVTPLVFSERAELVALAGQMYMMGLVGHTLKEVTARAFYAHRDSVMPLFTVLVNLAVFVLLALALMPTLGFAALALANSLSFSIEVVLMLIILWRRKLI
jgi:putative peptidoglycan lipid II flippase